MSWGLRSIIRELELENHILREKLKSGEVYIKELEARCKSIVQGGDQPIADDSKESNGNATAG